MGHRLDPKDWDDYRSQMHELLDSCVDRMEAYREKSWIPPPDELASKVELNADGNGHSLPDVMESLVGDVMPYATGNTNPRFFGWVHGGGLPSSIAADLVASTMNSNCGGRNHGANDVEIACINLLAQIAGFTSDEEGGEQPFGVLTGGTSQATIYALMAARTKKFGYSIRKKGILGMGPVRVYVSNDGKFSFRELQIKLTIHALAFIPALYFFQKHTPASRVPWNASVMDRIAWFGYPIMKMAR